MQQEGYREGWFGLNFSLLGILRVKTEIEIICAGTGNPHLAKRVRMLISPEFYLRMGENLLAEF